MAQTLASLAPHLRRGQAIVLESTTYPGTTEDFVLPALAAAGLRVGLDAFACYSPEREDPGNPDGTFGRVPKLVAGATRPAWRWRWRSMAPPRRIWCP
ncbi:hypothetical protein ACFQU7_17270 [Pseudoroseomonas wenyumeiae]